MSEFTFHEAVDLDRADTTSAALGAAALEGWKDVDKGKLVKLGVAQNYQLVAEDDEIEGFVVAVEPNTVNDGFSFGTVQRNGRFRAINEDAIALAIGDHVIAGPQVAIGTAGLAQVKTGAPTDFKWRVIRFISGTGAQGEEVLCERVNG